MGNSASLRALAMTALVLLIFVPSAWARKWSDRFGNSMTAKFVRVHEGKAVFLRAGKVVMVAFGDLVDEDQQYIRNELEASGQASLLPPAVSRSDAPSGWKSDNRTEVASQGLPKLPVVQRVWTDVQDRKITAGFVRTDGDEVVLLVDGKEVNVSLARLSRSDQNYVRARERAETLAANRGGESPLPTGVHFPGSGSTPPGSAQPAANGWLNSIPGIPEQSGWRGATELVSSGVPAPSGAAETYGNEPGSTAHAGMPHGSTADSGHETVGNRPSDSHRDLSNGGAGSGSGRNGIANEPEAYASNLPAGYPASGSRHSGMPTAFRHAPPSASITPPSPPMPAMPDPPQMPPSMFEEVGLCSNCNKEVSDDFGAGDNCPHCGVFFAYEEDESGQKIKTANSPQEDRSRITGRSIRGIVKLVFFGFAAVAGLCGWLCRKVAGE